MAIFNSYVKLPEGTINWMEHQHSVAWAPNVDGFKPQLATGPKPPAELPFAPSAIGLVGLPGSHGTADGAWGWMVHSMAQQIHQQIWKAN